MTEAELRAITQDLNTRDLLEPCRKHAAAHHVTVHEVLDDSRFRPAECARFAFWAELMGTGQWSYSALSRVFRRDRETIRYGVKRHLARRAA